MSFREIRAFNEILRNLHHPNPPSSDSFRKPNPLLTIELLSFLLHLYKPSVKLPDKYETTDDRVKYFRFIGEFVYKELRIKLKLKHLYESKEASVREMLKIAREVFRAQKHVSSSISRHTHTDFKESQFIDNIKAMKQMPTDITNLGIRLHDSIEHEHRVRKERNYIINQHHNIDYIRRDVEQKNSNNLSMIENLVQSIQEYQEQQCELESIKKRRVNEYERTKKRLERLSQYKPAHLEELESRENDMQILFDQYSQGCRNLEYLEYELQRYQQAEEEELKRSQMKIEAMRKRLYKQEKQALFEMENSSDEEASLSDDDIVRAPNSPMEAVRSAGERSYYQPVAAERQISRRPTSRRRPQSSNLYGTEKDEEKAPVKGSMYSMDDEESGSSYTEYSTEDSGELDDDSVITGSSEYTDSVSGEDPF